MPDWLVIGQESWDEVERRNQLLVRALAARHPHARFLFSELPSRPSQARQWRPPRLRRVAGNIWAMRPVRPLPDRLGGAAASDIVEAAQLRAALRRLGIERPLVWSQDPRVGDLLDRLPAARFVYDLTDDWAAFETDPDRRAVVQERIEALSRRAELVLACSPKLERDASGWAPRVHYLPNAVEPPAPARTTPADLAAVPRPRLGYVGTQHSSRLDVELLARSAELRPAWSFVLLGPDMLEPHHRARLAARDNVHFLGVRPHEDVRAYLEGLDIGLIPHLVNDFTRSLDPLKLYEYLAAGCPVIATPVDNAPDLAAHVSVVDSAETLIAAAEELLGAEDAERQARRRAAVADATWEARAVEVESLLAVEPPDPPTSEVSVVIVSFNTRQLLERCLTDLRRQRGVQLQTIVVDNASSDGSEEMVRERFPEVELIQTGENAGFARANNLAFERCRGEFVLLLNSDAFVHEGAIAELVAAACRHPRAGAVGARLLNSDGTLQRSAWPFPQSGRILLEAFAFHRPLRTLGLLEDLRTWAHDEERAVDFLIGACLLLRADALAEVGGFDEEFWLYGEEAELQRRMADRGWQVILAPQAVATHVGGASSGDSATRLRHFYTGQMRFLRKHGGPLAWPVARIALLVGSVLRRRWTAARVALQLK